jgi:hypothetical protein
VLQCVLGHVDALVRRRPRRDSADTGADALKGESQGLRSGEDQEVRIRSKKAPGFKSGVAREEGGCPGGFDRKPGLGQSLGRGQSSDVLLAEDAEWEKWRWSATMTGKMQTRSPNAP